MSANAVVSMLGTLVLMFVLPCAIALYFALHCYGKYLHRHDDQALEAFRVQAQERRILRQSQMRRGDSNASGASSLTNETKLRSMELSELFLFHTVAKHDEPSIILEKAKTKRRKSSKQCEDDQKRTNSNKKVSRITNRTAATSNKEPDGFKREDFDESDLELCMSKNNTDCSHPSPSQNINTFRDRLMRGREALSIANKSCIIIANNNMNLPLSSPPIHDVTTPDTHMKEEGDCCCICLDCYSEGDIICTPKQGDCSHVFHKECMFEWIKQNHDCCPLCRVVIIK